MKNIALWFARESNNNIILITDITQENRYNEFYCPICKSKVIPKAISIDCTTTAHFAHLDKSACSAESMIHFWAKHKLFEIGQNFKVKVNRDTFNFTIRNIDVEQEFDTPFGKYIPDATVYTSCGKRIFFEVNYKNKKNVDEYVQKWSFLNSIVVEVSALDVLSAKTDGLSAIYYNGKTTSERKSKKVKAIEALNERFIIKDNEYNKDEVIAMNEKINKISFVLVDAISYTMGEKTVEEVFDMWRHLDKEDAEFAESVLSNLKCASIMDAIREKKSEFVYNVIKEKFPNKVDNLSVKCVYEKGEVDSIDLKYEYYYGSMGGIVSDTKDYKKAIIKKFLSLLKKERKHNQTKEADVFLKEVNNNPIVRYFGYKFYTTAYYSDEKITVRSDPSFIKSYNNINMLKSDISRIVKEIDVKNDIVGLGSILNEIEKRHYKNSSYSINYNIFTNDCAVVKIKKGSYRVGTFYVNNFGTFLSTQDATVNLYYKKIGNKNPYTVIFDTLVDAINGGNK